MADALIETTDGGLLQPPRIQSDEVVLVEASCTKKQTFSGAGGQLMQSVTANQNALASPTVQNVVVVTVSNWRRSRDWIPIHTHLLRRLARRWPKNVVEQCQNASGESFQPEGPLILSLIRRGAVSGLATMR